MRMKINKKELRVNNKNLPEVKKNKKVRKNIWFKTNSSQIFNLLLPRKNLKKILKIQKNITNHQREKKIENDFIIRDI